MRLFQTIGILAVAKAVFSAASGAVMNRITYGFGGLSIQDFNLFAGTIKLGLIVTNNNPVEALVESFTGYLIVGSIQLPINQDKAFTLPPGQAVKANFTVAVANSTFLHQLADQIDKQGIPGLRIKGILRVGIKDKVIGIPIDQNIQIL